MLDNLSDPFNAKHLFCLPAPTYYSIVWTLAYCVVGIGIIMYILNKKL
jgi:hypothetical protein